MIISLGYAVSRNTGLSDKEDGKWTESWSRA